MNTIVPAAIKQLLGIVKRLQNTYPKKNFTLDGRLVGDLGEILVENVYDIALHPGLTKHHDAVTPDGKQVQIKATMKNSLTFPADHIPDYYLGIKINHDGSFDEIFNGPGLIASEAIQNRKHPKTNLHSISINTLKYLNQRVASIDRIPRRKRTTL
ncbi:MAG: hypothetical protein JW901_08540 [Dehalococcoidia bacterium]|nr:hypothetical protein [Dehalococcoidia bacterium]